MSLIEIKNLTFGYDGNVENIFENVSLRLDTDWKLGFTGRNGRGKTTFLNLLLGKFEYRGTITASVGFEYFPYDIGDASRTAAEIVDGIVPLAESWRLETELSRLAVSDDTLYRPFSTLSNGERTKILLAALFLKENNFLLIDEPTNHLDAEARVLVAEYLKSKRGFILVSHDRAFLDECVDHILAINKTNIEVQQGNFSSWYHNKEMLDDFERDTNDKLKKEIKKLEKAARQSKQWADKVESEKIGFDPKKREKSMDSRAYMGEQSRRMQQRRKNLERRQEGAIDEKAKLLKNIETADELKMSVAEHHARRLAWMKDVSVFYGEKEVCRGVSFEVMRGDRIALTGRNGCGKSSVLKLLIGDDIAFTGEKGLASGLRISYVPQDVSALSGTVYEYAEREGVDPVIFLATLRKLDFSREMFEKNIASYSAGQKKKVAVARSLCEPAALFIWDEPLNYIDVLSRIQIEQLISEYEPTLIFVEHDRAFVENTATKTVEL